jgi:hypothetical protein
MFKKILLSTALISATSAFAGATASAPDTDTVTVVNNTSSTVDVGYGYSGMDLMNQTGNSNCNGALLAKAQTCASITPEGASIAPGSSQVFTLHSNVISSKFYPISGSIMFDIYSNDAYIKANVPVSATPSGIETGKSFTDSLNQPFELGMLTDTKAEHPSMVGYIQYYSVDNSNTHAVTIVITKNPLA